MVRIVSDEAPHPAKKIIGVVTHLKAIGELCEGTAHGQKKVWPVVLGVAMLLRVVRSGALIPMANESSVRSVLTTLVRSGTRARSQAMALRNCGIAIVSEEGKGMDAVEAVRAVQRFGGPGLTKHLASIEELLRGADADRCAAIVAERGATPDTLAGAGTLKQIVGQINVVIHAVGILLCLPQILRPGEVVESLSLGAGNTGRLFDLETDQRVAEFKFIQWQGGPESIRQNGLFKDFYLLAEHQTTKEKYLYVLGAEHPMRFFKGRRALTSVLRDHDARTNFMAKHGARYQVVCDYYAARSDVVIIEDASRYVPELTKLEISWPAGSGAVDGAPRGSTRIS